ncbi:MAG TPA: STAS domain-containing protein [Acidimicrobiales bacterium]|nr:STAS domain-containing protein [Acidimicrobiales bacterium]
MALRTESLPAVKQRARTSDVPGYIDFSVSVTAAAGAATVRVAGDLDCYTAPQLRSALLALVEEGTCDVTLDVGGTQFMDSTGLSVLVGGLKRLREGGGNLVLKEPSAATLRLFEVTGLSTVFDIA